MRVLAPTIPSLRPTFPPGGNIGQQKYYDVAEALSADQRSAAQEANMNEMIDSFAVDVRLLSCLGGDNEDGDDLYGATEDLYGATDLADVCLSDMFHAC